MQPKMDSPRNDDSSSHDSDDTNDEELGMHPQLEEGVPLLPRRSSKGGIANNETTSIGMGIASTLKRATGMEKKDSQTKFDSPRIFNTSHNDKLVCYDHDSLLTFDALLLIGKSAFFQAPVMMCLLQCACVTFISAAIVFYVPRASKLDTGRFEEFQNFLKFFIVFMLGIYVAQAFKRWWYTVTTFEKFLIAVRQMVFMLHTLQYTEELRCTIEHYCVASSYLVNVEVRNAQVVDKKHRLDVRSMLRWLGRQELLDDDEIRQLQNGSKAHLGKSRAIWSWIAELVSHPIVEEGIEVKPPLLARTIILCQGCITEIENLKVNITMQTPFMYAQLLAVLVHVNNYILAVCCGMAIGSAMNEVNRRAQQLAGMRETDRRDLHVMEQLYGAIQTCGVQLMIALITPMLYVAFLHIAHLLCYPFGDESYHLPTETLIARLHSELNQMAVQRATFRKKYTVWKEVLKNAPEADVRDRLTDVRMSKIFSPEAAATTGVGLK